jgi:heat shock protein HtpX
MSLYTQQSKNVQETILLIVVFIGLLAALGYALSLYTGNQYLLYVVSFISIALSVMSYWFGGAVALGLSGAREISKQDNPELFRRVENLTIGAGLPMPRVYIIDDPSPNAFATGRDKYHSSVAFTTGLLTLLDTRELDGVIAHELAHIGNRDVLLATVIVVLVGLVANISDFALRFGFAGRDRDSKAGGPLLVLSIILLIISPILGQIIRLAISRKREFLADATGALLTRDPEGLASALAKLSGTHTGLSRAHAATAHMFIVTPFATREDDSVSFVAKMFMTHPPLGERIARLRNSVLTQ